MKDIYASLDIGASTIKLIVGEVFNGTVHVLYSKIVPSTGIVKGKISDEGVISSIIADMVNEAGDELDTKIESVILTIPPFQTSLIQNQGSCLISSKDQKIESEDIVKALNQATRFELPEKEMIVSVEPYAYHYGPFNSKELPIEKVANSVYVDALIVTSTKKLVYSYVRCVERAGLRVIDICINSYALAKEAFDESYLNEGAILLDIGYKTTTISFFEDGYLKVLTYVNKGGHHFTQKIADRWNIPKAKAETYKIKYGTCNTLLSNEDEIHVTYVNDAPVSHTQKDLALLMNEGVEELMRDVKQVTDQINDGQRYEVVIVGGGGELENIEDVASRVLETPVRVYRPTTIGARQMQYAGNLGMIYYLVDRAKIYGQQASSCVLPDVSHTVITRFRGFTKSSTQDKNEEKSINKVLDALFSDEE